jgi:hypothetical protein
MKKSHTILLVERILVIWKYYSDHWKHAFFPQTRGIIPVGNALAVSVQRLTYSLLSFAR